MLTPLQLPIPQPSHPIEWNENLNAWTVWQYQDVNAILKDHRFTAITTTTDKNSTIPTLPSNHQKHRSYFTQKLQSHLSWAKSIMQQTAIEALQSLPAPSSNFDLQNELTFPWCQKVALQLLSIHSNDHPQLLLQYAQSVFRMTNGIPSPKAEKDIIVLSNFFLQHLNKNNRKYPAPLLQSLTENPHYTPYLLSPIIQLFVGFTTSLPLLLGNLFLTLLTAPKIYLQKFINVPNQHIHELLRLTGPAQAVFRIATETAIIDNHTFQKGDKIALLLSHANRDINTFPHSHQFQFGQKTKTHLSLGRGIHACLGASLIREACLIFPPMVLQAFPNLELEEEKVKFGGSRTIWGVKELPVNR